jgi:hypothetical protein
LPCSLGCLLKQFFESHGESLDLEWIYKEPVSADYCGIRLESKRYFTAAGPSFLPH